MNDPMQSVGQVAEGAGKVADAGSKFLDFFGKVTGVDVRHRIRMAEAEAKAIEIINHAHLKAELQSAAMRVMTRELYRQRNLTAIVQEALPLLESGADPTKISEEFIHRFANAAEDVSEEELQKMFARILAQEAGSPNSVTNRTLEILHTMSKTDAFLIKNLASLVFNVGHTPALIMPNKMRNEPWFYRISFEQMMHLDDIGILNHRDLIISVHPKSSSGFRYFGEQFVKYNPREGQIRVSVHTLTWDGARIVSVAGGERDEMYYTDALRYLAELGLVEVEAETKAQPPQPTKLETAPARFG